jgi:hypothetical protein
MFRSPLPISNNLRLMARCRFFFFPNFVNGFEFLLLSVFAWMIRCYIRHLFLLLLLVSKSWRVVVFCCCHLLWNHQEFLWKQSMRGDF